MAEDLVAATSPAEPEPERPQLAAVAAPAEELPVVVPPRRSRSERARRSAYRVRFGVVYVLLAAVLGAGAGLFVVIMTREGTPEGPAWSDWKPDGSREAQAKQIAKRVGESYRLPSGNQLVAVLVGPPTVQDVSVRAIAVRPDTSTGQAEEDDIAVVDASKSINFILCGLGERCSIPEGEPSEARHQLLRREALELALYTFRYVEDVESVVVYLPPRGDVDPAEAPGSAVFFQESDLKAELDAPLSRTLVSSRPPELGQIRSDELVTIERLTRSRLFEYEFQQAQDGSAILILSPLILAGG